MQRQWQESYSHAHMPVSTLMKMQSRVNEIVNRIARHAQRPDRAFDYQVIITDQNMVNAWSYPGGKLFISKALIDAIDRCDLSAYQGIERDDVLAAVIAHEIAHVAIGHWRKKVEIPLSLRIGRELSLITLSVSTCLIGYLPQIEKIVWGSFCSLLFFTYQKYVEDQGGRARSRSRDMEYEADEYGIELMHRANYNMRGSLVALKMLNQASDPHFHLPR